jgi:uncharacterized membrane protein
MKSFFANLFGSLGKIWLEKSISAQIRVATILIIVQMGLIILFYPKLPPQIPLFFSRPWGEQQLVLPILIIILPIFSLVFLIINSLIASMFLDKEKFLSQVLVFGSVIFTIFNTIAMIKIFLLTT